MELQPRRSCRVVASIPIRVYGIDFRGNDFTEEVFTIIVNMHGAKIRLAHQLPPDSEIRLLSHPTGRDSVFRVVSKLPSSELKYTYWGIENLNPEKNIWGVEIPELQPEDQLKVRVTIECPSCSARDFLRADESLCSTARGSPGFPPRRRGVPSLFPGRSCRSVRRTRCA